MASTMLRLANMTASQASSGSVCVTPATSTAEDYVLVTFPSQFTIVTTTGAPLLANWATSITAPTSPGTGSNYWPAGAIGFPNALTPVAATTSPNTVKFQFATAATLTLAQMYCFDWTATTGLTSVGAAGVDLQGSVATENSSSTIIDSGNYAVTVLTNDQIVVSATVPPIFEFSMPGNTDTFGTMSDSVVNQTAGVTPTVKTNAKGGWVMWAKDSNQALTSSASGGSIPSVGWNSDTPTTLPSGGGAQDYALSVTAQANVGGGGSPCTDTATAEYNGGATAGGELYGTYVDIGACTGHPSNNDGMKLVELATISAITPAASDYTYTITVVGAGLF
jgi:hypothetical protein